MVEKTVEALKEEGFGVLTKIYVKQTLKEKLGVAFEQYVILGFSYLISSRNIGHIIQ